jgi:hypothetical protein
MLRGYAFAERQKSFFEGKNLKGINPTGVSRAK